MCRRIAMTTRGRGIAPPPPPGSSGGATSPASVSSNANSGSPMTKRLGLIREVRATALGGMSRLAAHPRRFPSTVAAGVEIPVLVTLPTT